MARAYDSTLRRERAAETRARIVAAGADILRHSSIKDWRSLTVGAVADVAGVNERTVYRHFGNERGLRDAVLQRLQEDAGIDLEALKLEDVPKAAARILGHVRAYPTDHRPLHDPTLAEAGQRLRDALLAAVAERAGEWSEPDIAAAAAILDVLWSVGSYERLVIDWELGHEHALDAITWVIGLVYDAVTSGPPPSRRRSAPQRRS